MVSRASRLTLLDETGIAFRDAHWREDLRALAGARRGRHAGRLRRAGGSADVRHWAAGDLAAGPSSGSYPVKGMLIVPASTACVAGVALGLSKDLLQRAASVTLKERRPLVVAVRETPLNGQTLRHLVTLDEAGAVVLPASPAFYAGATHIQDLVDFVAGRVLDAAGVPHKLYRRWEGELGGARGPPRRGRPERVQASERGVIGQASPERSALLAQAAGPRRSCAAGVRARRLGGVRTVARERSASSCSSRMWA